MLQGHKNLKKLVAAMALGMITALGAPRRVYAQDVAPPPPPPQEAPPPPPPGQEVEVPPPPPPAYIATIQPEYFEGRPVYWYGNHWYFRDERGWHFYRNEPRALHERRANWDRRPRYRYHR
jgi:hypothetical protein